MNIDKKALPTKLLWVDLEMTGLDPAHYVILEVAVIVTDFEFRPLGEYKAVIEHPESVLTSMDDWPQAQHDASGLTNRCRTEGLPQPEVQQAMVALIKQHFGDEPAILAGNSIHSDRGFIKQHWPEVDQMLHYRMMDVTSFKILMQGKYGLEFSKKDTHRADDDIRASIAELEFYLDRLRSQGTES